jgi:hypothetical protein
MAQSDVANVIDTLHRMRLDELLVQYGITNHAVDFHDPAAQLGV